MYVEHGNHYYIILSTLILPDKMIPIIPIGNKYSA